MDKIKVDIKHIKLEDNKNYYEGSIDEQEWTQHYNSYYEILLARNTGHITMKGFRPGTIPDILLQIKYPHIFEEMNTQIMNVIFHFFTISIQEEHKKIKITNHMIDKETGALKVYFFEEVNNNQEENKEDSTNSAEDTNNEEEESSSNETSNTTKKESKKKTKK